VLEASQSSDGSTNFLLNSSSDSSSDLINGKIVIRPEEIKIRADLESAYASGVIRKIDYYGHDSILTIEVESKSIQVRIPSPINFNLGQTVSLAHSGPIRF
jgi:ABC-type sugar transport system ATPase subunit